MIANETLRIIKQRRSTRSYRREQIRDEELQAVLEAGLYAPNAGGQAWRFTAVQSRDMLDRLNRAAKDVGRHLAGHLQELAHDETWDCLHGAPTLIIVSADEGSPVSLEVDCAAATQNMLLAAESLGLGSCWVYYVLLAFGAPQGEALRQELGIPKGYRPYTAAVVGYRSEPIGDPPERKHDLITTIR